MFDELSEMQKSRLIEIIEDFKPDNLQKFLEENIKLYFDCYDMTDVAMEVVEDIGLLNDIPEIVSNYFDYAGYGKDLQVEGHFYYLGYGVYVEVIA